MTNDADPNRALSAEELEAMMAAAHRPGILLNKTARPDDPGAPGCWLGGEPTLPAEIEWPWFESGGKRLAPMHFMAQIDLVQVPRVENAPTLPISGTLFFFFTPILAPIFGYPREACRVIYSDADPAAREPRKMPAFPDFATLPRYEDWQAVYRETSTDGFVRWNFDFLEFDSYWPYEVENAAFWRAAVEANADLYEHLEQRTEERRAANGAQGFAMHHLFGTKLGREPSGAITRLLTIQSDSNLGFVSGDYAGVVYWIPTAGLVSRDFNTAFLLEET